VPDARSIYLTNEMAGLSFAALAGGISADHKLAETLAGERSLVVTPSNESSDSHPGPDT
jgi:hypothetical protein